MLTCICICDLQTYLVHATDGMHAGLHLHLSSRLGGNHGLGHRQDWLSHGMEAWALPAART